MPDLLAAHGGNAAHGHRIEHRGDGAHVILAQQQPQEPGEGLRLPGGPAQDAVKLLQSPHQDLPELVILLGRPVVPGGIGLGSQPLQMPRQVRLLQKCQQGGDEAGHLLRLPEPGPKPDQRGDARRPGPVQRIQKGLALLVEFLAQAAGMEGEGPVPFLSPDAPADGIIFQFVANLRLHGRQEGF